MSYFNSEFDSTFRKKFACSYDELSESDVRKLTEQVVSGILKIKLPPERRGGYEISNNSILEIIFLRIFNYKDSWLESYRKYYRTSRLLSFFESSIRISELTDFNSKIKYVHSKIKKTSYSADAILYSEKEKIPPEFARLSLEADCLMHLTGFFLKKVFNKSFDEEILNSLEVLNKKLRTNKEYLTPYDRTAEFRDFLYITCHKFNESENNLPTKIMRTILSAARLFFTISDHRLLEPKQLKYILDKQKSEVIHEESIGYLQFTSGNSVPRINNKKYIKNWKVRHLIPCIQPCENQKFLADLESTDQLLDLKLSLLDSGIFQGHELASLDELK